MIYTPLEYSEKFLINGKKVSPKTVIRRCDDKMLPSNHHARKLPGEQGQWIIEIPDETPEIKKTEPINGRSLNSKHYSW
jgi:hypothetical protein